jgi:hypothetical protein
MSTLFQWLKLFGVIFFIIFLGELPLVKALSDFINDHRRLFFEITIVMTATGALALLWGFVGVGRGFGRPMTHEEFEGLAARTQILGPGKRFSKARFRGKLAGVVVPETTWSFHDLKESWRSGAWRTDSHMQRKYFVTAGGSLFVLSGFTLFAVLFQPPSVKLMLLGAVVYALVRLVLAFWRS